MEFKRPVYVPLDRSEEDWSFLKDPELRTDPWDPLKYITLRNAPGWYLTLAGEERSFYELYRNYNWGAGPQDGNGYYLNRFNDCRRSHPMINRGKLLCPSLPLFLLVLGGCSKKQDAGTEAQRDRKFQEMMTAVTLVGHSTRLDQSGMFGEEVTPSIRYRS